MNQVVLHFLFREGSQQLAFDRFLASSYNVLRSILKVYCWKEEYEESIFFQRLKVPLHFTITVIGVDAESKSVLTEVKLEIFSM